MKTFWKYQQDDSFSPLGVADSEEGAVESLRYFLADNSGTMPVPIEEPEIAAEVKGFNCYLTVLDD